MSHFNPGLISAYNSLSDKHLAGYFSNTRIRRHLQRAGLITRSGRIVPDKEYRHKLIQRAHQRHVRECLAQAIFHKVLEMERLHQIEIKRKLEEFARRERVHTIKVDRSKRYEEEIIRILSPRPPTGARGVRKQHSGPEGEHSESSESPSSSRPNTAPGKMQRPVRLKPIHSNCTTASLRRSSPYRRHESSNENEQPFNCTMDKESRRRLTTMDGSRGISPYCLPVINNFVTPVPPATKRRERGLKVTASSTVRGRRLRPTTASSGADVNEEPPMLRSSVHQSRVCVNMVYFGKTVHLSHDLSDMRDEVKVFQQHCGGENLCVYKGKLREGEMFQFISRRHRGFPFSLTFFLNGLQVERLSSCCEFKHRKGSRLGGRHGHFGFSGVEGASPCYKCIIAMGLDKKPTPPPKRVKDEGGREETVSSPKDTAEMETGRTGRTVEEAGSHSECETSQPQNMETQVKDESAPEEGKPRDDYEEDFEADDEGPIEDTEAKEKYSPSPSRETEKQVQERDASETEDDEKDEDAKSHSGSNSSGSDREESDTKAPKDSTENEKAEKPTEVHHEENAAPSDEKAEPNPEEAAATDAESAAAKDSDIQDSAGDSTEIEISDASLPSGSGNKQSDDAAGDKEDEKMVDESKQEEEQERTKSVQEKLAEAILKESQCSSEPELSDTSTEEEEEAADKGHKQDNKDAVPEKSDAAEAEVVQDQEETSEPKEQKDESEPHKSSESSQDETVKKDEGVEKAALEEDKDDATVEKDELEVTEDADAASHPVSEEKMSEDDKTSGSQDDAAAKSAEAAEKDKEKEQETSVEAEMGQGAKSSGEDESSVSELNKKSDETAVPDNAEASASVMTASETMEMKAEPSEEREALSCEEALVTDTERQQEDGEDRTAGSETEVKSDNLSSSLEGSGDTAVHAEKTADTSEDNAKTVSAEDDVKEEEAEEVSGAEASKDDSEEQVCDEGEETEKSVEINNKVEEEKSEEESKEEEKETNPDEIPAGESTEERGKEETDKTEEEENDESKTGERIENITEGTKTDSNTEGKSNGEQAEKTLSEEDKIENEEKAEESEKTENIEDERINVENECVKEKDGEEESEGKRAAADQSNKSEEINETDPDAVEKGDGAEQTEKDACDNEAEASEAVNKDEEESEEKKTLTDKTTEGEEISEITEEPEKSLDEDNVKLSDENIVELEDVDDSEAADANGTKTTEEMPNNMTEAANVEKEAGKESENGERGEVDSENGEKFTGAGSQTNEDEAEAPTEDKNDATEQVEEERKTGELMDNERIEEEKVTVESGDGAEKHEGNGVDQAPATDKVESEAEEGEAGVENQDESNKKDFEQVISVTEIKEETKSDDLNTDRKDSETEEMKEDPDDKDGDSQNDNTQKQVSEVIVASSGDQAQPSTPVAVDLDSDTDHKENKESDSNTDKQLHTDENTAATDLSAADGENGGIDMEEASKASEEAIKASEEASKAPEEAIKASEEARKAPEEAIQASEEASKASEEAIKASEEASKAPEEAIKASEEASKASEEAIKTSEEAIKASEEKSKASEEAIKASEEARKAPEEAIKASEEASKAPEEAIKASEEASKASEEAIKTSEEAIKASEEKSKASEEASKASEEASKASEEGASVLLKPEAQSTELTHKAADNAEERATIGDEAPEALANEDNTDMVTSWVTMHQTSKYFETFVEPLEDLKDSDPQTSNSNTEATQSTEPQRSVSPLKTVKMSDGKTADGVENVEDGHTFKDVNEVGGKTEVEAIPSDLESNESEDDEPHENDPDKDTVQVAKETEVKNLTTNTENEQNVQDSGTELTREEMRTEERKGSKGSLEEDKIQDGPAQRNAEETDISKTEVESIAGTNHSGASGKPESVTENQTEERMAENEPEIHEKLTAAEESKDLLSLPKMEEHQQRSESPELASAYTIADEQKSAEETRERTDGESPEVTEITDFTAAESDDGSQEEIQPKPSDGSISSDRKDTLIQDIKHTLSKDRLSTFSVNEAVFGRSSYPLLTAARTESGH